MLRPSLPASPHFSGFSRTSQYPRPPTPPEWPKGKTKKLLTREQHALGDISETNHYRKTALSCFVENPKINGNVYTYLQQHSAVMYIDRI